MKSLLRLLVENRIGHGRLHDPNIDADDVVDFHEVVRRHLLTADVETIELFLQVIHEMAEESLGGQDSERTRMLYEMPVEMGLTYNEEDIDPDDPDFSTDPEFHPELRPKLDNRLDFLVKILVQDAYFYKGSAVEADYGREQVARIASDLRREPPATIESFLGWIRRLADGMTDQNYRREKELLLSLPYDLGLVADPR